jgi:serine/threonine-protein kinase RsbW
MLNKHLELITTQNAIHEVEPLLFEAKDLFSIPEEKFYNLMIAVTEGINNAVVHGNNLNSAKKVRFWMHANEHYIEITIEDEGGGFDPDTVEDPRKPENLLKDSGRGVFLMRVLMAEVNYEFTSHGTRLIIKFEY